MKHHTLILLLALGLFTLLPEAGFAAATSGSANVETLFSGPLQKILDLLTGTVAGLLVGLGIVCCGIGYVANGRELDGWVLKLVQVTIGGIIMYAGGHIAKWLMGA